MQGLTPEAPSDATTPTVADQAIPGDDTTAEEGAVAGKQCQGTRST